MRIFRMSLFFLSLIPFLLQAQEDGSGNTAEPAPKSEIAKASNEISVLAKDFGEHSPEAAAKINALAAKGPSCDKKRVIADYACLEKWSPKIKEYTDEYGMFLQLGANVANSGAIVDQCNKIVSLLDKGSKALTLYQAACGTAQGVCHSSCNSVPASAAEANSSAQKTLQKAEAEYQATCPVGSSDVAKCKILLEKVTKLSEGVTKLSISGNELSAAVKKNTAQCAGYQKTRDSAIAGVVSALMSMKTAKNCEEDHNVQADLDCNNPQSPTYGSRNCQCARNELPPATCQGIAIGTQGAPGAGQVRLPIAGPAGGDAGQPDLGDDSGPDFGDRGDLSGSSAAGAPIEGGGGGGLGGGGGGGGGAQDGSGNSRSRLNPNILGGFGGGGGGGSFGSGPGYDGEVDSKLKAYMPGGEKDPSRTLASEMGKQVTPQAGRSNWEKVRSRYRDNYRTLLKK